VPKGRFYSSPIFAGTANGCVRAMPDLGQSGATDRERELHAIEGDGGLLDAACEVKPAYDDDDGDWEWLWLYYLGEAAVRALLAIERQLEARR